MDAGSLVIPPSAHAIVLFAHGSGSSRFSPRNRFVAETLNHAGFATLLFDLLTPEEDAGQARLRRFDIALLAQRLLAMTDRVAADPATARLLIGYFGASTGAAAGLVAAAERPLLVRALVSRGGRPDLAGDALERVEAPTLLIVGGEDHQVLELNHWAQRRLHAPSELVVMPGASHLFEEPGALAEVARLAAGWFAGHLVPASSTLASPLLTVPWRS
jgi:putative phosphoribosyl transferase